MNIGALRSRRMPSNTDMPDALCLEAADEIERLQAENKRMLEAIEYAHLCGFEWPSDPFALDRRKTE
jgi:hypothetical protein